MDYNDRKVVQKGLYMKKISQLMILFLFLISSIKPAFADMDEYNLLIKQNDLQIKTNQYQINKQLNEEKIKLIMQLNNQNNTPNFVQPKQVSPVQSKPNKSK